MEMENIPLNFDKLKNLETEFVSQIQSVKILKLSERVFSAKKHVNDLNDRAPPETFIKNLLEHKLRLATEFSELATPVKSRINFD